MYSKAAEQLPDHKLSILDCYDWTDVCKKINVTQFPTIKMYKSGQSYTYNGPLSVGGLTRLAKL